MYSLLTVISPVEYSPVILKAVEERRGSYLSSEEIGDGRLIFKYEIPHSETIRNFHGVLKGATSGFGSFELEELDWRPAELVVLSISINSKIVPELQMITHKHSAEALGRKLTKEFADLLPMQDHKAAISAHITAEPDRQRGFWGSAFGTKSPNFKREDTTRSKANKKIDLQRRQKKIKAEKERLEKLRQIGNVKVPKDAITSLFSLI